MYWMDPCTYPVSDMQYPPVPDTPGPSQSVLSQPVRLTYGEQYAIPASLHGDPSQHPSREVKDIWEPSSQPSRILSIIRAPMHFNALRPALLRCPWISPIYF